MAIKTKLALFVSVVALAPAAFASGNQNVNSNVQTNWAQTRAVLNGNLDGVTEKVTATSAAISNSYTAEFGGKTNVTNVQTTGLDRHGNLVGDVDPIAVANIYATDQLGAIEATAAAIGNSASITVDGSVAGGAPKSVISNTQNAYARPEAYVNTVVQGVDGEVALTSAAIGNSLAVDAIGNTLVSNRQINRRGAKANTYLAANETVGSVTATAAAIGNSANIEFATPEHQVSELYNRQHATGKYQSSLTLEANDVWSDNATDQAIESTSAAIANSLSVSGTGSLNATNFQSFNGDSKATSNVYLDNVHGKVDITTAALGNSASYDLTEAGHLNLSNLQRAGFDPTANSDVNIRGTVGDVDITSAAIANSLSVSTLPSVATVNVSSEQYNSAFTGAYTNVQLGDIVGNANITAAAIGNSVNISNLPR